MAKKKTMTQKDAARIQSSTAKKNGGKVRKGSFAAKAQSAASKNKRKELIEVFPFTTLPNL